MSFDKPPHSQKLHWMTYCSFAFACGLLAYFLGHFVRHPGVIFLATFGPVLIVFFYLIHKVKDLSQGEVKAEGVDQLRDVDHWIDRTKLIFVVVAGTFWILSFTALRPYPKFLKIPSNIETAICSECGKTFSRDDLLYVIEEPGKRPRFYCQSDWEKSEPNTDDSNQEFSEPR